MDQFFSPGLQPFILLLLSSLMSFVAAWFWFSRKSAAKIKEQKAADEKDTLARLAALEMELKLISQSVIPISTAFQAILIKELTHPHEIEFDELLLKVGTLMPLDSDEKKRLTQHLQTRANDFSNAVSPAERDAANILPAVIRRSLAEQAALAVGKHIKVHSKIEVPVAGQIEITSNQPVQEGGPGPDV